MAGDTVTVSKEGAKRSAGVPRFDLIPPEALTLLAKRFTAGAEKYGDSNWKQNMPVKVLIQHGLGHLTRLMAMDFSEDSAEGHIGAILWMGAALAWYHERDKEHFHEQIEAMVAKGHVERRASGAVQAGIGRDTAGKPVARTGRKVPPRVRRGRA